MWEEKKKKMWRLFRSCGVSNRSHFSNSLWWKMFTLKKKAGRDKLIFMSCPSHLSGYVCLLVCHLPTLGSVFQKFLAASLLMIGSLAYTISLQPGRAGMKTSKEALIKAYQGWVNHLIKEAKSSPLLSLLTL